jgi:Protein of unknown function (DUF3999)
LKRRLAAAALLLAPAAAATTISADDFRYERMLRPSANGYAAFAPDGPMFAHSRPGLADLRVLDADGRQTPWRFLPEAADRNVLEVELLNSGRLGGSVVALADLGPRRVVRNRLELVVRERGFVGRVTVSGSDDRRSFTRLSTTSIYDVKGATAARSTTLVFPPTDHRYLRLRATGLRQPIPLARAFNQPRQQPLEPVTARSEQSEGPRATVVELDLGFQKLPVDALRFSTSTARFDREVEVAGSNGGRFLPLLGAARIVRLGGVAQLTVPIDARHRRLRITILNGDDAPLEQLSVRAVARTRTIVLERARPPYRLLYGNAGLGAPAYDFQQVPRRELRPVRMGRLTPEQANPNYEPPEDTRSFVDRHDWVVEAALAFAAVAVGLGGFFALRRRA